jgi:hypothetical protein
VDSLQWGPGSIINLFPDRTLHMTDGSFMTETSPDPWG